MINIKLGFSLFYKVVDDKFKSYINQLKLLYRLNPLIHWVQVIGYPKLRRIPRVFWHG